ncbi:glycosyltransferase family 4 protein [Chromatocurvus halotolerans]|uniref:Alpha-1,3-rhamnosyl/mannosyltransferase n=1 Tax=Chromatocurvus halotolerans TaxID=1132028 RepID=A0A4R2KKA1_9GAMM|nr:glycosyltransferase family 1 protein [Chromatocurvus halotolerans]TCO73754.1 alpha-1,3-rhamnosyl/mannosyltransferase [Chromatocurvus halotolerans]
MRLILAVDAIFPPLTGIGRYALELAQGLAASGEFDSLRYYLHGRWLTAAPGASPEDNSAIADGGRPGILAKARVQLAQVPLAVRVYAALAPRVASLRLRRYRDHVFHSPNFILPPFAGPSVATVHDLSTVMYPQFHPAARVALMQRAMPQTVARATRLITPSESVRREVIAHFGLAAGRVVATPLGVDPVFAPRCATDLASDLRTLGLQAGTYLLCVATLEPRKNIGRLLDAYQDLPQALRQRYPLVLAGAPGWHGEALNRRIRDLAQGGQVRQLGYVSQAQLPALYAGARLFAFPALYEGFGLPVLEAMASGVPVVTSDCSSLPEVAGDAALLVNPLDTDALRAALARGLEDEGWRGVARERGLARAAERSWPQCVARTLAVYRSLSA